MSEGKSDHVRVATSGAWWGAIIVSGFMAWADPQMPLFCSWPLNTAVILGACWAMAAWKRAWFAWLAFWGMAACCVADGVSAALGLERSFSSAMLWLLASAYVTCWYWLVRAPRRHPPEPAQQAMHVIHHHVIHGGAAAPLEWAESIPQVTGEQGRPGGRPAIAPGTLKAVEAAPDPVTRIAARIAARIERRWP